MVFGIKLGLPKKGSAPAEPPHNEPTAGKSSGSGTKSALTVNEFVARTKRCREKGLEPTKPELIAYARYLGIDPIVDGDLMWITDEALNAPLPSEWTEHHDSADRVFYYNVQTHASSWTHPLEQLHRDTYKCIVNFRSGDLSKEERTIELENLRRKCEEAEREAHRELQAWSEHTDEQGQKFYYNREHQRSVWTDPRPARCHALYLQMKALRVLSKQLGQTAPTPHRGGPQPLSDNGNERFERDNLPGQGKNKKDLLRGGFGDSDGDHGHSGQVDTSSWGNQGLDDDDEGRGKRKKKHKKEKRQDSEAKPDKSPGLAPLSSLESPKGQGHSGGPGGLASLGGGGAGLSPSKGLGSLGGLPDAGGSSLLDVKKPTLSAVEEVRQAIGISGGTRLPAMGDPFSNNRNLFGRGAPDPLPELPGDGLSTVGRAKVRAGIRLEPIPVPQ